MFPSVGQVPDVRTWASPPYWAPPAAVEAPEADIHGRAPQARQALIASVTALPFISLFPCRLVDTRGNAPLTGGFLPAATVRSYTLRGVCNVPPEAQAISLNVTVVHPVGPGFLTIYPEGGAFPPVSTLNYLGSDVIVNAAVVPLSAAGGVSIALGVSGGDVILDTNGYYAAVPSVTSLNTLTGDLSLVAGVNVTITPSGGTLTIAGTGGPGGTLPTGTANQTLRNNGSGAWVASSALANDGTDILIGGNLRLPTPTATTGSVFLGLYRFLYDYNSNTFVGLDSGSANPSGTGNSGFGIGVLRNVSSGYNNAAFGVGALYHLTSGYDNAGFGLGTLGANVGGADNSALGSGALSSNVDGNRNSAFGRAALQNNQSGSYNVAIGTSALSYNIGASYNVALGYQALSGVPGSNNVGIGYSAGSALTSGNNNIDILNVGVAGESNTIRIGDPANHTAAYVAGIYGKTSASGTAVYVNASGQLGTTTSSRRYKEDITDVGDASDVLMKLRPVSFLYRPDLDETRTRQYGLIAEEVGEFAPNLVLYGKGGQPETVRYHFVNAMLLNEVQKSRREIDDLKIRLARLEEALAGGRAK